MIISKWSRKVKDNAQLLKFIQFLVIHKISVIIKIEHWFINNQNPFSETFNCEGFDSLKV